MEELTSVVERMEELFFVVERMEVLTSVMEGMSISLADEIKAKLIDDLRAALVPSGPRFYDTEQEVLEMKDRVSEIEAHLDRIESAVDARASELEAQLDRIESAVDSSLG